MARKYHPGRQQNAGDKPVYPLGCRIRAGAGVTRIDIFDDIDADGGPYGGISAKGFAEQLAKVRGPLQVNINSCGGDVWDGLTIMNAIRDHKSPTTTVTDGLAASIASAIFQAGHDRIVQHGAMIMIHDAFAATIGNQAELTKTAQTLGQVSDNLAGVYAARAGGTREQWRAAMRDESWYTAEEAVAAGLADRVGDRPAQLPERLDLAALGVVPGRIAARLREMPSAGIEGQVQRFAGRVQEIYDAGHRAATPPNHQPRRGGHTHRHAHPDGTDGVDWTLDADGCHEHPHAHGSGENDLTPDNRHASHEHLPEYFESAPVTGAPGAKLTRHRAAAPAGQPLRVRGGQTDHGGHELIAPFGIVWQDPDGTTRSLPGTPGAADVPGAKLDGYEWARSWGSFLAAVSDERDRRGARAAIARVQREWRERPRAAGTLSERVPSQGGFTVPERLRTQILTFMTDAVIRPRSQYIAMDSLRVPVPVLDNPTQASGAQALGGMTFSMVGESATIPASVPTFGVADLEARKFAGFLTSVPNELVSDATPFTDVFLPKTIAQGFGWAEDDLLISGGTGVGEPQALINAPAALFVTRTTGSEVVLMDIVNLLKKLHPASKKRATWVVADEVFGQLLDMYVNFGSATSGITPPPTWLEFDSDADCWRLLGLECVPHDHLPALGSTGDVMLVDLSLMLVADRGEMTVERSAKGTGFGNDTSSFRIKARIDGRYWPQTNYITAAGQTVSPLVILK